MKKIILLALAALTLAAAPQARAWTYGTNDDVLLIFRKGTQNVEFDLGSVTQFLGKTNGYTTTVTNWDLSLVTSTIGSVNGAKVVVLATAGSTNWLSSAEPNSTAYNVSSQVADNLHGVISAVGTRPLYPIAIATAGTNAYSIDTSDINASASYDYVVSGGHFNGIAKLGGYAPFVVEQSVPGLLDFWSVKATTVYPNSPPDQLVGTFYITSAGGLTFVAGPRGSTINSVSRAGNVSSIQFSTTVGNTYSVAYTNKLGGAVATWPVDAGTVIGNGKANTINHTSADGAEFYRIKTQ